MRHTPAPRLRLSKHFSWAEVTASSGYDGVPRGPFRLPSGKIVTPRKNARRHALALERLRALVNAQRGKHGLPSTGIRTISWARSWQHNKDVGGAIDSRHLYFDATDIDRREVARLCPWKGGSSDFDRIASTVFGNGGFGTYPGGARHVDSRGYRARWSSWVGWKSR
jgi:hypothetical protein